MTLAQVQAMGETVKILRHSYRIATGSTYEGGNAKLFFALDAIYEDVRTGRILQASAEDFKLDGYTIDALRTFTAKCEACIQQYHAVPR